MKLLSTPMVRVGIKFRLRDKVSVALKYGLRFGLRVRVDSRLRRGILEVLIQWVQNSSKRENTGFLIKFSHGFFCETWTLVFQKMDLLVKWIEVLWSFNCHCLRCSCHQTNWYDTKYGELHNSEVSKLKLFFLDSAINESVFCFFYSTQDLNATPYS